MTFTTPPPPLDIEAEFPEFAELRRPAVRLHPRQGQPGVRDSSLGGPLLWPADEPWPVCTSERHDREPIPMVAVLQLFARDLPELPYPDGTDVFQLLWCPGMHEPDERPLTLTRWRAEAPVRELRDDPPAPDTGDRWVNRDYLPRPCVLSPERIQEYPAGWELSDDLRDRVQAWDRTQDWDYFYHLGAAPGTKAGGWPDWIQDPDYPECDCGVTMVHLVTVQSWEFDGESQRRWVPLEERRSRRPRASLRSGQAGLMIGDAGAMYYFTCLSCGQRPVKDELQCS